MKHQVEPAGYSASIPVLTLKKGAFYRRVLSMEKYVKHKNRKQI
jgi:hypothetical protein